MTASSILARAERRLRDDPGTSRRWQLFGLCAATILLASIASLLSVPPARAAETARDLAAQCQSLEAGVRHAGKDVLIPQTKDALQCWGYMHAIQDLSVLTNENGNRLMGTCPGEQTTLLQLTQAFTSYARQHPDELDNDAALIVIKALQAAFPCPSSNASLQPAGGLAACQRLNAFPAQL